MHSYNCGLCGHSANDMIGAWIPDSQGFSRLATAISEATTADWVEPHSANDVIGTWMPGLLGLSRLATAISFPTISMEKAR